METVHKNKWSIYETAHSFLVAHSFNGKEGNTIKEVKCIGYAWM